jgi:DNA polymerase III delta subunit
MDILSSGDRAAALRFVRIYLASGESAAGLWPTLLWLVSQLTQVVAAYDDGAKTEQAIIKHAGLKYGTVRSLLPIARRMDRSALLALVEMCAQADIDMKTGQLRMSVDAPQEQEVLIDLCVAGLCRV